MHIRNGIMRSYCKTAVGLLGMFCLEVSGFGVIMLPNCAQPLYQAEESTYAESLPN